MSDHELLQRYLRDRSHDAFATLVERHLALVYSAAHRQVRSSHLAEEVAQSVFLALSRQAADLSPDQSLVAWLHVVTRRSAIDVVRREVRRQAREQAAAELADTFVMTPPPDPWTEVEPLLDEAVETLAEPDRTAILLRFFQNKSLREVGAALGTSDDAAQKRVTRALDQLHRFFLRRGITIAAAALATDLSAHALHTVPAGLGATISTATTLSTVAASGAALEGTRIIVMTTLQKSLAAAALLAVGGVGLYQAKLVASQSSELSTLALQNDRLAADLRSLRASRLAADTKLQAVERRIDANLVPTFAPTGADAALAAQMEKWFAQRDRLKAFLTRRPEFAIPELAMLSDQDWFEIAATKDIPDNDEDLRRATALLRHRAENMFANKLSDALREYAKAHDGTLPTNPRELAPFFTSPIDLAILDRYQMMQQGKVADVPRAERMRLISAKAPADPEQDPVWTIGIGSFGNSPSEYENFRTARSAFQKAHPGETLTDAAQLTPYLRWPLKPSDLQQLITNTSKQAPR